MSILQVIYEADRVHVLGTVHKEQAEAEAELLRDWFPYGYEAQSGRDEDGTPWVDFTEKESE